jgi:hypothetical protein
MQDRRLHELEFVGFFRASRFVGMGHESHHPKFIGVDDPAEEVVA